MDVFERKFENGDKSFKIYRLINDNGMEVEVLSLGGVITKILTPDRDGNFKNVVLELENLEDYYTNEAYRGAIVGRTAGRIGGGSIKINGVRYDTTKNKDGSTLHGGIEGFSKKIWESEIIKDNEFVGVRLNIKSADGEEGYPGNVDVEVIYKINNENKLIMEYSGTTDKTTVLNLTNHNYYNLSGNAERKVEGHILRINGDKICEAGDGRIVTGNLLDVEGTPFDFRNEKELGKDIKDFSNEQLLKGSGYDHIWILNNNESPVITFKDPISGRAMDIDTDASTVVCYSMNFADGEKLSCGKSLEPRMGCCFETQSPAIGYNSEFIDESILNPGETYKRKSVFRFYVV